MTDTSTPVVVLTSVRHGGLNAIRTLGRLGIPAHVVDGDPRTPAFSSRYCRGKHVWDMEKAPLHETLQYLADLARTLGRRAVLLATTDIAAEFVAANTAALEKWFLFPHVRPGLIESLHNKRAMHSLAETAGVPTPKTSFPESRLDALQFGEEATFPVIMKTIETRNGRGSLKAIVHRKEDLLSHYNFLQDSGCPNVLLQEFIPGGEDANWMFNGYFNAESDCLFGMSGRKLRQYRPYAGVTSLGIVQPNSVISALTTRLMKAIGYRGILDVGYRYDARDGRYKIFDVNPRVGCTFRLFVSDTGMDVVRALYLHLTNQPVIAGEAAPGRRWIVEDLDAGASFQYWRNGTLSAREWLRSLQGVRETALFAKDDLHGTAASWANVLLKIPALGSRR